MALIKDNSEIKEFKVERKFIGELFKRWVPTLGLQNYDVKWSLKQSIRSCEIDESFVSGACEADARNKQIFIDISSRNFTSKYPELKTHEELSVLVAHELTHAVLQETVFRVAEEMVNLLPDREEIRGAYLQRLEDEGERLIRMLEGAYRKVVI